VVFGSYPATLPASLKMSLPRSRAKTGNANKRPAVNTILVVIKNFFIKIYNLLTKSKGINLLKSSGNKYGNSVSANGNKQANDRRIYHLARFGYLFFFAAGGHPHDAGIDHEP